MSATPSTRMGGRPDYREVCDEFAMSKFESSTARGIALLEEIYRLRSLLDEGAPADTIRMEWLERFGTDRFSKSPATRHPNEAWFDCSTDGSDYSPTLRDAIDNARTAIAKATGAA